MGLEVIAIRAGISLGLWGGTALASLWDPGKRPVAAEPPKALKLPRAGKGTVIPLVYGSVKLDMPPIYWAGNKFANTWEGVTYRRIDYLLGAGIPPARNIVDWYVLETPPRLMAIWVNGFRIPLGAGPVGSEVGITHGESWKVTSGFIGSYDPFKMLNARVEFFDGRDGQDLATGTYYRNALELANGGIPVDPDFVPGYARQMCVAIITSPGWNDAAPGQPGSFGVEDDLLSIFLEVQAFGTEAILTDGSYYEANPAMVLLDLLAGDVWKLGMDVSLIDTTSFFDCGDTLIDEGFGMSMAAATRGPSPRLFVELLDTINGIIFKHPVTGKLTLKLIRNDYNPSTIPVLDNSNTIGDPEVQFVGWDDLVNQVDVEFTDRSINWVTNLATAQHGASAVGQGGQTKSRKVQYPAITSAATARKAAAREIGVFARPLMTATVRVNRTLHAVGFGDAVKANWVSEEGDVICTDKIFRVVDVDHGTPEDGAIQLGLIEDVFDSTEGGLPPWVPPWGDDPPFEIPGDEEFDPGA